MWVLADATGTAALAVIAAASVTGVFTFMGSRHTSDTDASLRSDDAAWKHLQETVQTLTTQLDKLGEDFGGLQVRFQEAIAHNERCDTALDEARRELAELRRRFDEGQRG